MMKRIKKMIIVFFTVLTVVCFFGINTKTVYADQTYSYKYKKVKVKKEGFYIILTNNDIVEARIFYITNL